MNSVHFFELELIRRLQWMRCDVLDQFFLFMNFFDTGTFFYLLMIAIWLFFGRKLGREVFYIAVLSFLSNAALKHVFELPRPAHLDHTVALMTHTSFGFPSGAAQATISVFGLIAWRLHKNAVWFAIAIYTLLVCISRVYLGMHFFTDIFGGLFFGALLLMLFICALDPIENWLIKLSLFQKLIIAFLGPCLFYLIQPTSAINVLVAVTIVVNIYLVLKDQSEQLST